MELVLHPSAIAQWYALINEAEQTCNVTLNEEVESYLVFLLMRFTQNPQLANSVLAVDFLQGLQKNGELRQQLLKEIGDKCLLFSGLFPGLATRRRLSSSYFIDMGQSAYSLVVGIGDQTSVLFAELSEQFAKLIAILQATRCLGQAKAILLSLDLPLLEQSSDANFIRH